MSVDTTLAIEYGIGIVGVLILIVWLGFIAFLLSIGELEVPVVLLLVTIAGAIVIGKDALAD